MRKYVLLAATAVLTSGGLAKAELIGINFGAEQASVDPTAQAGLAPQLNFNNESGATQAMAQPLVYASGLDSGASVTWSTGNTYGSAAGTGTNNDKLLHGYLDTAGAGNPSTVTVTGVPLDGITAYTVLLYVAGDNPGTRTGDYTVNGVTQSAVQGTGGGFVFATPTTAGNVIEFDGVTGSTLTIVSGNTQFRAPLDGLQIYTPEPATASLLGLSGLSLLLRRRRA